MEENNVLDTNGNVVLTEEELKEIDSFIEEEFDEMGKGEDNEDTHSPTDSK